MKNLPLVFFLLLAFACSKPGEQSASSSDSTTQKEPWKPVNVVIWNEVGVHDAASEKGKYITSIYLGEKFEITGDTSSELSGSKRIHYHKILLSDGKTGWVRDEFIALDVYPAAVMSNAAIYKRPDIATVTDKSFATGDFVVVRKMEDSFVEVTGKLAGDKWFTNGVIKAENISYEEIEAAYTAMKRRVAEETKENMKATLQSQLDNEDIFEDSYLWSSDHGFPGSMGHAGAGVDDPDVDDEGDPDIAHSSIGPGDDVFAFYPLDDMLANDVGKNGYNGKAFNVTAAADNNNSANGAMKFDGTSYITIDSIEIQPPFSVVAYFKLADTSLKDQCVVSRGRNVTGTGFNLGFTHKDDGTPIFYFGLIGSKPVGVEVTTSIEAGDWVELAATFEDRKINLFINGEFAASTLLSPEDAELAAENLSNSKMPLEIGRELESLDRYFHGSIDNVAVWNRVLSDREIKALY